MKIAILGTRGIPANYGGFETFAEECAARMSARGHQVTVYCRSHYVSKQLKEYRGAQLVVLPTVRLKYTDTATHSFLSMLHALWSRFDAVLICNAANSAFALLPRLFGMCVVVNVDGIERKRQKWGWPGRMYYRFSERLATLFPNAIVSDARVIQDYYREEYGVDSIFIPYGAVTERPAGVQALESLGLCPGEYFLYVSRLEPENNAHLVVAAFEKVHTDKRLVIVGDAPYARTYIRKLRHTTDSRILFPGAIYGEGYRQLLANTVCYIQATEVGGTHPALIEAMGQACLIIANATPENEEVLGNAGLLYRMNDVGDLALRLQEVVDSSGGFENLRELALQRARGQYSWDDVVAKYEELFEQLLRKL